MMPQLQNFVMAWYIYTSMKLMKILTYTLNLMDVLANLNAFVQYIALPRETYDAYISTVTLAMPKQINWVVL